METVTIKTPFGTFTYNLNVLREGIPQVCIVVENE